MKQLSRKLAAFFLTLAILLSFATVAFAHDRLDECEDEVVTDIEAEPLGETDEGAVSPLVGCDHEWTISRVFNVRHAGTYVSANSCKAVRRTIYLCTICKATTQSDIFPTGPHEIYVDSATCTGTVQTLHKSCNNCGGVKTTETRACPGASHIGTKCLWLPI